MTQRVKRLQERVERLKPDQSDPSDAARIAILMRAMPSEQRNEIQEALKALDGSMRALLGPEGLSYMGTLPESRQVDLAKAIREIERGH